MMLVVADRNGYSSHRFVLHIANLQQWITGGLFGGLEILFLIKKSGFQRLADTFRVT